MVSVETRYHNAPLRERTTASDPLPLTPTFSPHLGARRETMRNSEFGKVIRTFFLTAAFHAAPFFASGPEAVSPGSGDQVPMIARRCPTFSWEAVPAPVPGFKKLGSSFDPMGSSHGGELVGKRQPASSHPKGRHR